MHQIARRTAGFTAAFAAVALVAVGCGDDNKTPSIGDLTGSAKAAIGSATAAAGSAMESAKNQVGSATESAKDAVGSATESAKDAVGSATDSARSGIASAAVGGAGGSTNISTPNGDVAVAGPILAKYSASGGDKGTLGAPTAAQESAPNGGTYQDFVGGTIYAPAQGDAHIVWGEIRKAWEADGGANGALGYPTSDEHPISNGLQSDFQNGHVTYINGQTEVVKN